MSEEEGDTDIIELIEKGEYKLHDKLGEGSYGEVFLAEKLKTNEPFAIKVMQLSSKQQLRNFIKERYFSTYFNQHRNILQAVEVYVINDEDKKETFVDYHISQDYPQDDEDEESGEEDCDRYGILVLEPMDFDLMDYIISKGRLTEEESKLIFREICKAMKCCHEKHVAHLDLKPDNILLKITTESDHTIQSLKVCDFGFAVEWDSLIQLANQNLLPTNFKILFGTKEYQSPETFKKTPFINYHLLEKVDVWSLGVTLFVMITGLFPFVEKNGVLYTVGLDEVAKYCNNNNNNSSSNSNNNICKYEESAVHLVERMLANDPLARPSVSEILTHPWLLEKSLPAHRLNQQQKKKKRRGSFLRNFSDKCFELENDNYSSDDSSVDGDSSSNNSSGSSGNNGDGKKKKKNKIKDRLFNMYTKLLNTHNSTGSIPNTPSQYHNNNNNNNNNNNGDKKKKY